MANKRINFCCVLLSAVLFMTFILIGTTESYARYEDTFSCRTVLVPGEKNTAQSDLLVMSTDAQQIVLVGELSSESRTKTVSFNITAGENPEKGKFSLTNGSTGYVEVLASTDSGNLEHAELTVPEGTSKKVTLTFTAKDMAFSSPHEELDLDIEVIWGELKGTFRVTIPEIKAQEQESGGETADEPQNLDLNSSEEAEVPSEPQTAEEEAENKGPAENGIMSIGIFDASGLLPVKVTLKDEATEAVFGMYDQNKQEPQNFPAKTRFSLDGGETFFILAEESKAEINKEDIDQDKGILFDFSKTNLAETESISVAMRPWNGGLADQICSVTVDTGAEKFFRTEEYSGEAMIEVSRDESGERTGSEGWKICTLDGSNSIEFFFPAEWAEAELSATVQILTLAENGTAVYNSAEEIVTEYKVNEETGIQSLRIGTDGKSPKAGTYRVYLTWKYKDIVFMKTEIPFFINYSTPFGSVPDSQEVPYGN